MLGNDKMSNKNIDYWDRVIRESPVVYKKSLDEEERYLIKNIKKDSKILEVGCGTGRSLRQIIHLARSITAIDHDKKAIEKARRNFKNYQNVRILLADAKRLPFKNNSFDTVICMTTFSNFGDYKIKILNEMCRVVKDNGMVIISMYGDNAFNERMKIYKKFKAPIKKFKGTTVYFDEKVGDNVSEQFSKKQLIKIFNKTKLKIIEIKRTGIFYVCKLKK